MERSEKLSNNRAGVKIGNSKTKLSTRSIISNKQPNLETSSKLQTDMGKFSNVEHEHFNEDIPIQNIFNTNENAFEERFDDDNNRSRLRGRSFSSIVSENTTALYERIHDKAEAIKSSRSSQRNFPDMNSMARRVGVKLVRKKRYDSNLFQPTNSWSNRTSVASFGEHHLAKLDTATAEKLHQSLLSFDGIPLAYTESNSIQSLNGNGGTSDTRGDGGSQYSMLMYDHSNNGRRSSARNADTEANRVSSSSMDNIRGSNHKGDNHKRESFSETSVRSHSSFKMMSNFLSSDNMKIIFSSLTNMNIEDEIVDDNSSDDNDDEQEVVSLRSKSAAGLGIALSSFAKRHSQKQSSSPLDDHIIEIEKLCDIFLARSEVQQLQGYYNESIDCLLEGFAFINGNLSEIMHNSNSMMDYKYQIKLKKMTSSIHRRLGTLYKIMGDFEEAEVHTTKHILLLEEIMLQDPDVENFKKLAFAYSNLAIIFDQLEYHDKAIEADSKALENFASVTT